VKPVFEAVSQWDEPVTITILPDHPTPCHLRTHTSAAVPFVIYRPGQQPDAVQQYDEFAAVAGNYGTLESMQFMQVLLGK
jgi:2,3-bisphosphoglycerate-independent phosphoglycerate mutase